MLKTSIRRILALVCVISLMVTNCFVLTPQVVAEAGDETPATLKSMAQEGYTVVTPQTFGVPDTTGAAVDADFKETMSLDKLLFAANVTRPDDGTKNNTYLYYLQGPIGQNICSLQIRPADNRLYIYNYFDYSARNAMYRGDSGTASKAYGSNYFSLKPTEFGLTSFKGTELEIWITTEFVKAPWLTEGEADDLKIGIWINGKLYKYNNDVDTYFYVPDCKENTYLGELRTSNEKLAISSPVERFEDVPSTMPEGYKVVTPLTFDVPDTTGTTIDANKNETLSLDKLLFAANVTRPDDGTTNNTYLYYLQGPIGENICSLQIRPADNRLYLYNYFDYSAKTALYKGDSGETSKAYGSNYFSLKPTEFGLTSFKGTELEIWITTEFVKAPWLTEGEADDLKIGLWINGKLYQYNNVDTYFYVLDCKENTYQGELRTSNEKLAISSPFMEPNDMGMVGGEYASATGEFYDSTTTSLLVNKLMDGTTFHSSVRFEGEGGTLYYGSKDDATAIKLTSTSKGILVTYGTEELTVINQNTVGIPTLNNNFNLKLKTEFVNCDDDETTDDVKLGIYVDNKYKSFDLVDAAATLTATIGVKTTGDATVLVGDFASAAPEQVSWDLNDGAYTKEKTDGVTRISVDGVSVDGNLELNAVGIYSVVVTKDGKVYMEDVTISGDSTEPPVNPPGGEEPPLEPEEPLLPTDFTKITPVDFGMYNDTYTELVASTLIPVDSMHGVSFETNVTYTTGGLRYMREKGVKNTDKSIRINYYSSTGGLRVFNFLSEDKKLYVDGVAQESVNITPSKAISGATTFAGLKFSLRITTEYVDYDNDNKKNDIKLGIWFNGNLYNEQYMYIKDCATNCEASLAVGKLTLDTPNGEEPEVDFSIMGFTKDWKQTLISTKGTASGTGSSINRAPYTGEQSTAGIYLVMSVLSLAAVAYVLWAKRGKMSE